MKYAKSPYYAKEMAEAAIENTTAVLAKHADLFLEFKEIQKALHRVIDPLCFPSQFTSDSLLFTSL